MDYRYIAIGLIFSLLIFESASYVQADSPTSEDLLGFVKNQLDLGYRIPGSEGSERFKEYISDFVANTSSWTLSFHNFSYMSVDMSNLLITKKDLGSPVLGDNQSTFPKLLIGAHFDSRAKATKDPINPSLPVPGANDGGSGVAIILALLLALDAIDVDVGFVLFDGEDQGYDLDYGITGWGWIQGSTAFAETLSSNQVDDIEMFLLLDMVGDKDLQIKKERNSNSTLNDLIWSLASELGYASIFVDNPGYSIIDDHIPFLRRGIPSVDLIDFDFPYHHTLNDDINAVSGDSLFVVYDVTFQWIMRYFGNSKGTSGTESGSPFHQTSANSTANFSPFFSIVTIILVLQVSRRKTSP